jgi:hypothetical protein
MMDLLKSCPTALCTITELEKPSFFAVPNTLPGALTGLFINGFMGVFSLVASSSSELWSFEVATCVAFF